MEMYLKKPTLLIYYFIPKKSLKGFIFATNVLESSFKF